VQPFDSICIAALYIARPKLRRTRSLRVESHTYAEIVQDCGVQSHQQREGTIGRVGRSRAFTMLTLQPWATPIEHALAPQYRLRFRPGRAHLTDAQAEGLDYLAILSPDDGVAIPAEPKPSSFGMPPSLSDVGAFGGEA
jgi:hypothetical protein